MKTIAIYLPQFHRVKENDQWWGEGHTEWTAVKSAEVLFDKHKQPKKPLDNNYYNLMDKETMLWQAQLASKYGVDGFCFYHYYFKDGRKILEKPAENLLKWEDINMPFCFCWANATWTRTWSKLQDRSSWGERFEEKNYLKENNLGVLIKQDYGDEEKWEEHFYYLLPFFKDKRYIRYKNKPVFLIYAPELIGCLFKMKRLWCELAKREGLEGIYLIGANVGYKLPGIDDVLLMGPIAQLNSGLSGKSVDGKAINGLMTYDYKNVCEATLTSPPVSGCVTYLGLTVNYDDSPRRGKKGYCFTNTSPELFEKYYIQTLVKSLERGNEFVFLNAWNEWGEGNYLEPDEENKYSYLEAVKRGKASFNMLKCEREFSDEDKTGYFYQKFWTANRYCYLLEKWMKIKENNHCIENFFERNNIRSIAIYGWGDLGKHLYNELDGSKIVVKYVVDTYIKGDGVLSIDEFLKESKEIDAIVITPIPAIEEIYNSIYGKIEVRFYSIIEVIEETYEQLVFV